MMSLSKLIFRKRQAGLHKGFERRNYSRLSVDHPLRFKILNPIFLKEFQIAKAKNISQSGLLFKTVTPPPRKSYILIDLEKKVLKEFAETDQKLIVIDHKIMGRVMRTHLNLENGLFEIAVRFVHLVEKNSGEVETVLKECKALNKLN